MDRAYRAVGLFGEGSFRAGASALLAHPDHGLFGMFSLPAVFLGKLNPDWNWLPGMYFAAISAIVVWQVGRVARAAGAGEGEYRWALLLAASSTMLLYFSRHFLPYDLAFFWLLLGLEVGLRRSSLGGGVAAGVFIGLGVMTYNGYWLSAAGVLAVLAVCAIRLGGWSGMARSCSGIFIGGVAMLGAYIVLMALLGGAQAARFWTHAATIRQGDFGGGTGVLAEYLWTTEGLWNLAWLAALMSAILGYRRVRNNGRVIMWLAGAVVIAFGLIALCDIFPVFVVYGRLVRQVAPFLCLLAAAVFQAWSERVQMISSVSLVLFAAWNFSFPFRQIFPREFIRSAEKRIAEIEPTVGGGHYRIWNAEYLWGTDLAAPRPPHAILWRHAHPLEYAPYRLEGFSASRRQELALSDIAMKLVRIAPLPFGAIDDDPEGISPALGPLRLKLRFDPAALGRTEPIITTGVVGRGDFVFVSFQDSAHITVGMDHWGVAEYRSGLIPINLAEEHELIVSVGSLLPDSWASSSEESLKNWLLIALDGQPVLMSRAQFHPTRMEEVTLGWNLIGGTTTATKFSGEIIESGRASLADIQRIFGPLESR